MAANFGQGPVFPSVAALPLASDNAYRLLVQGAKLWFSTGATWIDLGASGGGGSITWTTVTTNTTMTSGVPYVAEGALDMTLPATAAGEWFFVYAADAEVRIVSNGNIINRVGSGNDLTMQAGESAYLVVRSAGNLEIVP